MTLALPTVDSNVLAAVAAAGGAILIKIVEKWIGRRSEVALEAEKLRGELRLEIARLRDENTRLNKEMLEWHQKLMTKNYDETDSDELEDLKSEVIANANKLKSMETIILDARRTVRALEEEISSLKRVIHTLRTRD